MLRLLAFFAAGAVFGAAAQEAPTMGSVLKKHRHRAESWFVDPADGIGICNVPLPVRPVN